MYKPNFCADCGTRIERLRWHPWTSRRFCAACSPRLRRSLMLLPAIAALALFSLGLLTGRLVRPAPPPLVMERGELPLTPAPVASKAEAESKGGSGGEDDAAAHETGPVYGPSGTATERPTDPDEIVSICGARTQKGTPCRRRVRGTGRCWQHKGMPAITRNTIIN